MFKSPLFERLRAAFDAFLFPSAGGTREQRTEAEYMPDRLSAFFMRPAKGAAAAVVSAAHHDEPVEKDRDESAGECGERENEAA